MKGEKTKESGSEMKGGGGGEITRKPGGGKAGYGEGGRGSGRAEKWVKGRGQWGRGQWTEGGGAGRRVG